MYGYTVYAQRGTYLGRFATIAEVLTFLDVAHYDITYKNGRPWIVADTENQLVYKLYTRENPYENGISAR